MADVALPNHPNAQILLTWRASAFLGRIRKTVLRRAIWAIIFCAAKFVETFVFLSRNHPAVLYISRCLSAALRGSEVTGDGLGLMRWKKSRLVIQWPCSCGKPAKVSPQFRDRLKIVWMPEDGRGVW
ncbi:hypothetical protein [Neogemmobacter tilapiae]|uniref:hypothetical protein n=1 Tax=Neogemmobacter tilapiae TaxID=875041 RepID=UPI001E2B0EAB|nr:hypothetical protein [Gemmobacter tilapiae]